MNTQTLTLTIDRPYAECTIPDWLQECLNHFNPNDPVKPGVNSPSYANDDGLICRAFDFAYKLHQGQTRKSGEPYICHPIAVAGLLRYLGGSGAMVAAGFLHDVVEDTPVTPDEIEERFGPEVRQLVEGVTKLSKLNFSSKTEREAENFRRMFVAMAKDIRVIIVKLADRLHNMRTLEHLANDKQRNIAKETREIFAPLANRLGIGRFKWELEDLAFKYLEPEAYRQIQELVTDKRVDREAQLAEVTGMLRERMEATGIRCYDVSGRPKHLYGIYQKMNRRQKQFHEVYDIAAVRIIVETKDECYRALAIVHDSFRPIPGRFKDYIGLPKPNRYQSLHTGVIGKNGRPIEVQIRTLDMHYVADYGIAAHWKYKETGSSNSQLTADDGKFTWLRQLLEWQNDLNPQEYLDNVKDNLFDEDVYVFTPNGDVIPLKQGATTVDFAYRIHTEIGNHCVGARINDRMVPLDTTLKNGDIVEIITHKNGHPSTDWMNFVVTTGAKHRIRQWFKRSYKEVNIARGRELLEKELSKKGFEALLKSERMQTIAQKFNYHNVDDLLAGVGYGEITLIQVLNRLRDVTKVATITELDNAAIQNLLASQPSHLKSPVSGAVQQGKSPIAGVDGLLHYIAGCCNPLPGEPIIGVVSRTKGLAIHRQGCINLENAEGDRLLPVSWNQPQENGGRAPTYPVNIEIEVFDRVGVLKDILSRLMDNNINVRNAQVKTQIDAPAIINLCIDIASIQQFERTANQIKNMGDVLSLRRIDQTT